MPMPVMPGAMQPRKSRSAAVLNAARSQNAYNPAGRDPADQPSRLVSSPPPGSRTLPQISPPGSMPQRAIPQAQPSRGLPPPHVPPPIPQQRGPELGNPHGLSGFAPPQPPRSLPPLNQWQHGGAGPTSAAEADHMGYSGQGAWNQQRPDVPGAPMQFSPVQRQQEAPLSLPPLGALPPGMTNQLKYGSAGPAQPASQPANPTALHAARLQESVRQSQAAAAAQSDPSPPPSSGFGTSGSGLAAGDAPPAPAPQDQGGQAPAAGSAGGLFDQFAKAAGSYGQQQGEGPDAGTPIAKPLSNQDNVWNQALKNGQANGMTPEEVAYYWKKGQYVSDDGDLETVDWNSYSGGAQGNNGVMVSGTSGNYNPNWDDLSYGAQDRENLNYKNETADKKAQAEADAAAAKNGAEASSAQDMLKQILGMQAPQMDSQASEGLIKANQADMARRQATALRAAMEGGARVGANPEQMIGVGANLQQQGNIASSQMEATERSKAEVMNFQAQIDHYKTQAQSLMQFAQMTHDSEMQKVAIAAAQKAQQLAQQNSEWMMLKKQEMDDRITGSDVLGGVLGLAGTGLGGYLGGLAGKA